VVTICPEWVTWTAKRGYVAFWEYDNMFVIRKTDLPSVAKKGILKIGKEAIHIELFPSVNSFSKFTKKGG